MTEKNSINKLFPTMKFRFINLKDPTESPKFYYFDDLFTPEFTDSMKNQLFGPDYVYDSYTGLNDKNGNEIYSRDIIKLSEELIENYHSLRKLSLVAFDSGCYMYSTSIPLASLTAILAVGCESDIEVVGNIHRDENLLLSEDSLVDEEVMNRYVFGELEELVAKASVTYNGVEGTEDAKHKAVINSIIEYYESRYGKVKNQEDNDRFNMWLNAICNIGNPQPLEPNWNNPMKDGETEQ